VTVRPNELKDALVGVMSFTVTPFASDHALDLAALERHLDTMAHSGVHQIAVAGAVGEFYALTFDEYTAVIRTALRAVGGRVPVLVGIGHSTRIAVELARCAADEGASGLLVNPLYLAVPGAEGLYRHHEALADAVDLGQVVFSTRGTPFDADTLARLAQIDHVVGLKDELGDLQLFLGCVERLGDRIAWIDGMAEPYVAPYFASGARCFTTGLANFAPEIPLAVYEAARAGDFDTCNRVVRERVTGLADLRRRRPGYHTAVLKEALELMGRPVGPCRLPLVELRPEDRADLERLLRELGVTGSAARRA
jgi:5-dehydro-4-deoxyglucarate dehydratase